MKSSRSVILSLTSLLAVGAVAFAAVSLPSPRANADAKTPGMARNPQVAALYSEKCSACHNLPNPDEKQMTRAGWRRTVNRMLNKHKASDSIAPAEAAQIVDYLATFAPKNVDRGGLRDPWATDAEDVWTIAPAVTRVFNFESQGSMTRLSSLGAGTPGPAPVWHIVADTAGVDSSVVRAAALHAMPGHFSLLMDKADSGRNLDVRVRFRIESGKASPAVGIAFGFADPKNYSVLRFDQNRQDLALIKIAEPAHTTVQQTALAAPVPGAAPAAGTTLASTAPPLKPLGAGWHTLRLLVRDGQARGWIDMNKRISVAAPGYVGGKVGLWVQGDTVASFDDWTVDVYDDAARPAAV